ncbi:MAG: response regulator, partial [Caulobacterales bacterium]|nr:response regulator [Caulobacterales bacterium]
AGRDVARVDAAALAAAADAFDAVIAPAADLAALESLDGAAARICLTQLGDSSCEALLAGGRAHDLIERPASRRDLAALLSRLDQGALRGAQALRAHAGAAEETDAFAGRHVLVADDSAVNREVMLEALSRLEVTSEMVEDGAQAVAAAERGRFVLIFMDGSMPELDGFEASRRIRAAEEQAGADRTPIIALTAHVVGADDDALSEAGMDDLITKPFRLSDIRAAFERWVEPAPTARAAPSEAPAAAAPAAGEADTPVLDEMTLQGLRDMGAGGSLLRRVHAMYRTQSPDALQRLLDEAERANLEGLGRAAHALKSMSHSAGAARVAAACADLERRCAAKAPLAGGAVALRVIGLELREALTRMAARERDG